METAAERLLRLQEKQWAATSSALAAVGLTLFKIVVGLTTGSLGILAEAAHSGLDLVAAIMTTLAVRISDKPPDNKHLYGHGKAENVSALFETLLLLITCVWIVHCAIGRLRSGKLDIEVNSWSFVVMVVSIIVDISRSRMLTQAAKKFHSQALEADALHFSTDIWSSAVVILGLIGVKASAFRPGWHLFKYADAVAAIFVGVIVVYVSFKLGWRTIHGLLDTAPEGMQARVVEIVERVPGVKNCHNVRVRFSGTQLFVDLHIVTDGEQSLRKAHDLSEEIERALRQGIGEADITVHPEPA